MCDRNCEGNEIIAQINLIGTSKLDLQDHFVAPYCCDNDRLMRLQFVVVILRSKNSLFQNLYV